MIAGVSDIISIVAGLSGHFRGFRLLQSWKAGEPNFPREPADFSRVLIGLRAV
jgi:hypothetical protein